MPYEVQQQVTEVAETPQQPEVEQQPQEAAPEQQEEQPDERPRDEKGRFKGVQQRFDELTRARHEAEREAAYWKAIADGAKQSVTPPQRPSREQFASEEDFVEAVADWKAEQRVQEAFSKREEAERQRREVEESQRRQMTYAERAQAAAKEIPDFYEVVSAADIPVSDAVRDVLIESDKGPELTYHLAKNPDVAERINAMAPLAAARELGRIEASLSKPQAPTKPVTKAPAPIRPIGQGQSATKALSDMSHEEYRAMRAKEGARWAR